MVALRTDEELAGDARRRAGGMALGPPEIGRLPLRVKSFHQLAEPGAFGNLVRIVVVEGEPGMFAPGTSGTIWTIDGMPAAMQVGAFAPDYRLGVGQSLLGTMMDWARPTSRAAWMVVAHTF